MRREEPNRHGRAADALIASYVRELLLDDDRIDPPHAPETAQPAPPPAALVPAAGDAAADATL